MPALNSNVLVLNQNYLPLNVCNARRAITLLDRGKAEVVEETPLSVHTTRSAYPVPSIIRMTYSIKRPMPQVRLNRREIFARDNWSCQYCGIRTHDLTLDHVLPRIRGGQHTWENLVSACRTCNHRKGSRTPEEARMFLSRTPARPRTDWFYPFSQFLEKQQDWRPYIPGYAEQRARSA